MRDLYSRNIVTRRRREVYRLLLALAVVLAASFLWYAKRPYLIRAAARSSFGHPDRDGVIRAAFAELYPDLYGDELAGAKLLTSRVPAPGYVQWLRLTGPGPSGGLRANLFVCTVADSNLRIRGTIRSSNWVYSVGDWDRDGLLEATVQDIGFRASEMSWAIVRLRGDENELAGFVTSAARATATSTSLSLYAEWRDEDNDGIEELVIIARGLRATWTLAGMPLPTIPPTTVAVFEWDKPGGVLRVRRAMYDGSVVCWRPEDGRPLVFSADESVDAICKALLRGGKANFESGTQPATRPASRSESP